MYDTIQALYRVKRFNDYETLGELFRASEKDAIKLTIPEQLRLIINEIAMELSEMLNKETEMLMEKLSQLISERYC